MEKIFLLLLALGAEVAHELSVLVIYANYPPLKEDTAACWVFGSRLFAALLSLEKQSLLEFAQVSVLWEGSRGLLHFLALRSLATVNTTIL